MCKCKWKIENGKWKMENGKGGACGCDKILGAVA
jgi:hypothetical protein